MFSPLKRRIGYNEKTHVDSEALPIKFEKTGLIRKYEGDYDFIKFKFESILMFIDIEMIEKLLKCNNLSAKDLFQGVREIFGDFKLVCIFNYLENPCLRLKIEAIKILS